MSTGYSTTGKDHSDMSTIRYTLADTKEEHTYSLFDSGYDDGKQFSVTYETTGPLEVLKTPDNSALKYTSENIGLVHNDFHSHIDIGHH
ncbi:hypothetical protein FPOAC2_07109 [Fusarium poae]|uniref:hypothetical protein n=1 Tax=Fusarium poae TaxID=36050 RepID=UPI001CEAB17C|nr:hypothetical protein FPOAC1_006970 [Fusarium poae]KAG8673656.1 hypothetical protein FPOAC1_006970 [Fusarium poae]